MIFSKKHKIHEHYEIFELSGRRPASQVMCPQSAAVTRRHGRSRKGRQGHQSIATHSTPPRGLRFDSYEGQKRFQCATVSLHCFRTIPRATNDSCNRASKQPLSRRRREPMHGREGWLSGRYSIKAWVSVPAPPQALCIEDRTRSMGTPTPLYTKNKS